MKLIRYFLFFFFLTGSAVFADAYHNINGFFGERAAGLAGAYSAISDDPSGAFYNPAGIGFAYDNSISISASNYKIINKSYKDVDSPNQSYSQTSRSYLPNFIGIVSNSGDLKIAFSVVNQINENYSRNDQISIPVYSSSINNTKIYNIENYSHLQFGPSFGYKLGERLSVGMTLYFFENTQSITRSTMQQYTDNSYVMVSDVDNRRTLGLNPIFGIQFMPMDKLSLGFSVRRNVVTARNRLISQVYTDSLRAGNTHNIDFTEGTHHFNGSVESGILKMKALPTGEIPQNNEFRAGVASFLTRDFMMAFDIIHSEGYVKKQNQIELAFQGPKTKVTWNNPEIQELTLKPTTNFAFGMEYYLTTNLALLGGVFTNYSNAKEVKWEESAFQLAGKALLGSEYSSKASEDLTLAYAYPEFRNNPRKEFVNNLGYSVGISFASAKASISLTLIREKGLGQSRIDYNSLSQQFQYNSTSIYLVASSRN